MLKELLAANIDLCIDQGDTFYKMITIRDNVGAVMNLTGISFSIIVKRYYNTTTTYPAVITVVDPIAGQIAIEMTAVESANLRHDRYVYSILATSGSDITKILHGQILVSHL